MPDKGFVYLWQLAETHAGKIMVVDVVGKVQVGQQNSLPPVENDQGRCCLHARAQAIVLVFTDGPPAHNQLENRKQGQHPVKKEDVPGPGDRQGGDQRQQVSRANPAWDVVLPGELAIAWVALLASDQLDDVQSNDIAQQNSDKLRRLHRIVPLITGLAQVVGVFLCKILCVMLQVNLGVSVNGQQEQRVSCKQVDDQVARVGFQSGAVSLLMGE